MPIAHQLRIKYMLVIPPIEELETLLRLPGKSSACLDAAVGMLTSEQ